ncbi:MAG: hypothetical protein A2499_13960 [Stygiobacter sp. RIFOXYC12_FULL_38_8]|nr:MAG: hypothetical protein FD188_211 [Ignavibacteria bacterium]OGU67964.1 MAG: hypothetical protein A2X62_01945 [Stygiobacter sp. GWC2_38_9]OGU85057.1 MAG: hypothetical protein A2279_07060 [Stygiobacter sp. RIFOXYA12_FULL_38_9]OGV07687.1 MAG: hypothetical protein A2299_05880 [Stygiobacter sp. RIFOXYB2_FULL_37_11]OGV12690.1 MAG: hypothetical protein A2440_15715 [Stygiobacter sp. RIFOXYC2_FULL_38_25]OGV17657.1 MAG: hypothetical protein A2237_17585 [Stygiobacter sp. RIFOXYA2_FULL_38_8]OGV26948
MATNSRHLALEIIGRLAKNEKIESFAAELQNNLQESSEQFLWKTLNKHLDKRDLENEFRSAWMFVLRKNTPSEAHYHPNSTQYTAIIKGDGTCEIGGEKITLQKFDPSMITTLYVIDQGVSHEFFPGDEDLVVLSLHTVAPEELIEINCSLDKKRNYQ